MIHYLGIDPGEHAGLALIAGPIRTEPRRIVSRSLRLPEAARDGITLVPYTDALQGLDRPDHAAIEHPFPVYTDGKIRNLTGYETQLRAVVLWRLAIAQVFGIIAETPYPSEWQTVHRGTMGDSTKARAVIFARVKFSLTPETDHEADALGLAYWLSTRYSWTLDESDPRIKNPSAARALSEHFRRHGGDPAVIDAMTRKTK
jgi:hypothetical protein